MTEREGGRRDRWSVLLVELAVIFVGITASFWVDEWREKRQDTETFHRILGEIYYNARVDESVLTGWAAANNAALLSVSELALRDEQLPPADELFRKLESVFTDFEVPPTLAGYSRLANTPLAIPINDIQLTLDNSYGLYQAIYDELGRRVAELRSLRQSLWFGAGVIPCNPIEGISTDPATIEAMDLLGQLQPAFDAIRDGEECLADASNRAIVTGAMQDVTFRTGLRRVLRIREGMASALAVARFRVLNIRWQLEAYLPDITLPIETIGIVGSATPAVWDVARAIDMRRMGPNDWVQDVTLTDGEIKFSANREWTINWGGPRPWVAVGSVMSFDEGQTPREEVFPSGTAQFNGINIPVRAGHYRVRFNTQSGEYSFERLTR